MEFNRSDSVTPDYRSEKIKMKVKNRFQFLDGGFIEMIVADPVFFLEQ